MEGNKFVQGGRLLRGNARGGGEGGCEERVGGSRGEGSKECVEGSSVGKFPFVRGNFSQFMTLYNPVAHMKKIYYSYIDAVEGRSFIELTFFGGRRSIFIGQKEKTN